MLKRKVATLLAVGALTISLAACGDDSKDDSSSEDNAAPSTSASSAAGPFGAGCAGVPKEGEGSVEGMTDDPVATAASNNPLLTTLTKAVTEAGLVDTLNSAEALTVFAPADSAFAKIPEADFKALLADKDALAKALSYHVVAGKLSPEKLAGTHKTLVEGTELTVTGEGENFTVNGKSKVVCGNVQTANATVYVIDTLLEAPAS
jgi:uncharacterized surface protein with fasciclin (FAS1) repeats